jgi:hypothetical protein
LASAQFIAYSTWMWLELQEQTGKENVYRYHFEEAPPVAGEGPSRGAYHSADIEYVFQTLDWKKLPWTEADRRVSDQMSSYWTNFAKTGDPNGPGLPKWPRYAPEQWEVMHLGSDTHASPDGERARYLFLDHFVTSNAKESSKQQPKRVRSYRHSPVPKGIEEACQYKRTHSPGNSGPHSSIDQGDLWPEIGIETCKRS